MSKVNLSFYQICKIVSHKTIDGKKDNSLSIKLCDYSYKKCAFKRLEKLKKVSTNDLYEILFFPFPFCDENLIKVIYSDLLGGLFYVGK